MKGCSIGIGLVMMLITAAACNNKTMSYATAQQIQESTEPDIENIAQDTPYTKAQDYYGTGCRSGYG